MCTLRLKSCKIPKREKGAKKNESEKSINFVSRDEKKELNWDDDGVCIK
jgi:hypothetical protein